MILLAYKRYINNEGKKHGPYYYKNVREEGKVKSVELFHDPSKGGYSVSSETRNSTASLMKMDRGYYFKLSTQTQAGQLNSVASSISDDEAIILRILLEKAVEKIYGW